MASDTPTHDRVVRHVAATRFPFPGQADWPAGYRTITNESQPTQPVPAPGGPIYPDIVIVDASGRIREVGEVETEVGAHRVARWAAGSAAADDHTATGARHFFVYVPAGLEGEAHRLLETHAISYAGLRTYHIAPDGAIRITPILTPGDPKDHR